jgi:CBS domain-containing protein
MTVKAILSHKGTDVMTTEPTATLEAAARLMAKHRIGALLVLGPDHTITGILSERDIVRTVAQKGDAALGVPVGQAMTRRVVTCTPSETLESIMQRMTDGKFRHVPVMDHERLCGIVSIGDVVRYRLEEMEREQAAMRDYILTA